MEDLDYDFMSDGVGRGLVKWVESEFGPVTDAQSESVYAVGRAIFAEGGIARREHDNLQARMFGFRDLLQMKQLALTHPARKELM